MEALIGLAGVVVGSLITGLFLLWSNRQNHQHEEEKEKRRLLLEKYELIYSGLLSYQSLANEISLQMLSEAGYSGKFDGKQISKDYASSNLKMNVSFYAPELCDIVDEMDVKHSIIGRAVTEFILDKEQSKNKKGDHTGAAVIAAAELQKITDQGIKMLSKLASEKVNA